MTLPRSALAPLAAAMLLACAQGVQAQQPLRTEDLVGRWGVASYFAAAQKEEITGRARSACSQPYVIGRGKAGGAVMFEAFQGKPVEVVVRGRQIGALVDPQDKTNKDVVSWSGRVLELRYREPEAATKYGTMVFVRCGG